MSSSNERIPLRKEEMKKGLFHSPISSVLIMFVLVLHGIVKVRVHGWEELQAYRCWAEFSILVVFIYLYQVLVDEKRRVLKKPVKALEDEDDNATKLHTQDSKPWMVMSILIMTFSLLFTGWSVGPI
ncbi:unnamed protein product [Prunus armeniaca]|uniref:Uncharacterized protein n=1 Tax=Prunus armeniaca TaxID=36596 RepID=A0A6J5UK06_PRUAR|nr:unnamed protein product [Prunus armeniaca]